MTTDDGLKGLTDLQWFQIYAAMDDALLKFEMTEPATAVNPYLEKRRATAANAARQWLAANVDDSEQLSESDKDIALGQAVTFAEYVSEHAKGKMVEAAQKFLSMDYSKEIAKRLNVHDSGDSDAARYRFCRDNWSKLTTATLYGERGHYVEQIYLNTFGLPLLPESIDAAIDAAILAEKGEV